MLIPIECWSCGMKFQVHARYAGKVGTCPNPECGRKYLVPGADQAAKSSRSPSKPTERKRASKPHAFPNRSDTPVRLPSESKRRPSPKKPRRSQKPQAKTWLGLGIAGAVLLLGVVILQSQKPGGSEQASAETAAIPTDELQFVAQKPHPASGERFEQTVAPFLKKYCFDCHGNGAEEGGLKLDEFQKPEAFETNRKRAESIFKMINGNIMPPEEGEHPPMEERLAAVDWIDARLNYVDCDLPPDPGRVTIRRLNRAEYNNTIRDLVGIDFEPAADFPSDEVGNGFDNIGDVLSLPPLLLEKYLDAAEVIAKKAIIAHPERFGTQRIAGKDLERTGSAGNTNDGGFVTMSSSGSVIAKVQVASKGEYIVRVDAMADQAGSELAKVELRLDDKKVKVFDVKGQRKAESYETKLTMNPGSHKLEAAFINDFYDPKAKDRNQRDRNLYVRQIEVVPTDVSLVELPETHRQIIFLSPDKTTPPKVALERILTRFIGRAFRRPALPAEVEKFTNLGLMALSREETFEQAVQLAVTGVLVSPHFLFRVEDHAQPNNPAKVVPVTDYELASRLSYFLWSSMPDEELFQLAAQAKLRDPDILESQVRRMLKDAKSEALVENFGSQWLNLRNLNEVSPDPKLFPAFSDALRKDMRQETEAFFTAIIREDLSVMDFLFGEFTFLNERLAKHYGISGVKEDAFQKVSLKGTSRKGVLTQASILTLTSNPTRTSPVKRGKWILENLLNEAPPPPPPNVPELEATAKSSPGLSLRKQLELHRASPNCASCHKMMDPLGLGFENFNAIGQWRDQDGKLPVDATGELPGGSRFNGPMELIQLLKQKAPEFRRCLAEKMLTYALGRGLEYYDRCAVDTITANMEKADNRFSSLVLEIVKSQPFLYRRGEATK